MVRKITELEKVPIQQSEVDEANHFFNKAFNFEKEKKYAEAIACYDKVIKIVPIHHLAWYNKAGTLARLAKYEEAITCYNVAIKLYPTNKSFWTNKGLVSLLLKKYAEAIACFEESLRLDSTDKIAQKYRVFLEKKQKENKFV